MPIFKALGLSILLLGPVCAWPQDVFEEPALKKALAELATSLDTRFEESKAPGMAIALVHDQKVVWTKSFGYTSVTTKAPVTAQTIFRIGSITKLFTATMLMQLRDAGLLDLDQSAELFMPLEIETPATDARPVSFRHLVSHTSGFPPEGGDYWQTMSIPTIDQLYAANPTVHLKSSPFTSMSYSNFGVAILGNILARMSGTPYEDYVVRKILRPLGMTNTAFSPAALGHQTIATGYATTGGEHLPVEPVALNALTPAGQTYSSVLDLAKFISLQFGRGASGESRVLRASSVREMHQPVFLFPNFSKPNPVGFAIGIGWFIRDISGHHAVGHGGGIPGYTSDLTLVPRFKVGVATLTNGGAGPGTDPTSLNREILEKIIPIIATTERDRRLKEARFDRSWNKYLGDYDMVGVARLSVVKQGDHMVFVHPLDQGNVRGIFVPVSENLFVLEGGVAAGATVRFEVDDDEKVTGLEVVGILSRKL